MTIYKLMKKDKVLATMSPDFSLCPYYVESDLSKNELAVVQSVVEDLCIDKVDFAEYSKFFLNDYKIKMIETP